jgi:predicted transposase/invertase (TIGR01784 family)
MITDPIFYRLFETSPETFFLLLGMSPELAREMAARYQYEALEFKEIAHRSDGIFRPTAPGLPVYFLEVQFYPLASVFADLLVKAYTFLKRHDPAQEFCGVVLFASRALEPRQTLPYEALFAAGQIRRYYLDEMPEIADAPLGMAILDLLRQSQQRAPATARELVARVKSEIGDDALRTDLIQLVETIIIGKLPRLTRQEIEVMLQLHDIRESRVYQEAREEGRVKGLEEGFEKGLQEERRRSILRMTARKMPVEDIAECLGLNVELVREIMAETSDAAAGQKRTTGDPRKRRRRPE